MQTGEVARACGRGRDGRRRLPRLRTPTGRPPFQPINGLPRKAADYAGYGVSYNPPMTPCDLLIRCRWCIPVAPSCTPIERAAIAVAGDRILAVGPSAEVEAVFAPEAVVDLGRHAVIPGLVNAHGHAAMSLLRGAAEDLPLQQWLTDVIWPLEAAHLSPEYVRTGTELAMAEMLSRGITTFADMYYYPEEVARCAVRAGMRVEVAFPILDFANDWSRNADEALQKGMALRDEYRGEPLVNIAFGPHAAYTVSRKALEKTAMFAEELDSAVQIHLHENAAEVAEARGRVGKSWIFYLHELGLLTPSLQAVHMTQLTDPEIELVAAHNVKVIHCPHSNLKLASGICPVHRLLAAGVTVALGTDGAASNNTLDLLAEARLAALLAKQSGGDPTLGDAPGMLHMATLGGARALGLDRETGSLEPGKLADIVAFDLGAPRFAPMRDPVATLVHGAPAGAVSHVWVAGRCLFENGAFATLDTESLNARAERWLELKN